jgi:hypothetical protein
MIQITPQMRIVVAVDPQDFRKGIDGLARICREVLEADPFFCGVRQSVARRASQPDYFAEICILPPHIFR